MLNSIPPACMYIFLMLANILGLHDLSHLEIARSSFETYQGQDIHIEVSHLTLSPNKTPRYLGDNDVLYLTITNDTSRPIGIIPSVFLEVFDGEFWRRAPVINDDRFFGSAGFWGHTISAYSQRTIAFIVDPYIPLESGLYRANVTISYFHPRASIVVWPDVPPLPELPIWWDEIYDIRNIRPPGYASPRDTHELTRYDLTVQFVWTNP